MRKPLAVAVVLVLMGAGFVFDAAASVADDSGQTMRLLQRVTSLTSIDNGDPGESAGGVQVFAADLYQLEKGNRAGKKVGRSGVVLTTVSVDAAAGDGEALGLATYVFPEGKITGQTFVHFSDSTFTGAITGGTGSFRKARGDAELRDIPDSENDGIVILRLA